MESRLLLPDPLQFHSSSQDETANALTPCEHSRLVDRPRPATRARHPPTRHCESQHRAYRPLHITPHQFRRVGRINFVRHAGPTSSPLSFVCLSSAKRMTQLPPAEFKFGMFKSWNKTCDRQTPSFPHHWHCCQKLQMQNFAGHWSLSAESRPRSLECSSIPNHRPAVMTRRRSLSSPNPAPHPRKSRRERHSHSNLGPRLLHCAQFLRARSRCSRSPRCLEFPARQAFLPESPRTSHSDFPPELEWAASLHWMNTQRNQSPAAVRPPRALYGRWRRYYRPA